jgi:hypothetical protein
MPQWRIPMRSTKLPGSDLWEGPRERWVAVEIWTRDANCTAENLTARRTAPFTLACSLSRTGAGGSSTQRGRTSRPCLLAGIALRLTQDQTIMVALRAPEPAVVGARSEPHFGRPGMVGGSGWGPAVRPAPAWSQGVRQRGPGADRLGDPYRARRGTSSSPGRTDARWRAERRVKLTATSARFYPGAGRNTSYRGDVLSGDHGSEHQPRGDGGPPESHESRRDREGGDRPARTPGAPRRRGNPEQKNSCSLHSLQQVGKWRERF